MLGIFSMAPVSFPPDFIWGSATAGYQIEGDNIHSGHWHREVLYHAKEPSGKACNFWNLWPQDFAMLSELGHRMFRMSVEWARIEPEEKLHDEEALARYLAMFKELKKRGIKLCLTLHHFSQPQWFEEKGEFNNAENIGCFLRHLEYLVPKVAPYVDLWNIFNEFNNGDSPSLYGRKTNCLIAHARAAQIIRAHSKAPVSTAHAMTCYQPLDPDDEFDVTRTRIRDWVVNRFFYHAVRTGEILFPYRDAVEVPELKGSCDFWAINYYTRHFVSARKAVSSRHECQRIRPIGRDFYLEEFYPQGLVDGLCQLKDLPVYITENGFCCDDDRLGILYRRRCGKDAMSGDISIGRFSTTMNGAVLFRASVWSTWISKRLNALRNRVHTFSATFFRAAVSTGILYSNIFRNSRTGRFIHQKNKERYLS